MIRFVVFDCHSGVRKRVLMPDYHIFKIFFVSDWLTANFEFVIVMTNANKNKNKMTMTTRTFLHKNCIKKYRNKLHKNNDQRP